MGILVKLKGFDIRDLYIYCMTSDGKDYPFTRFWCRTCSILVPMFGVQNVYMWDGVEWVWHDPDELINEVENVKDDSKKQNDGC